MQNHKNTIIHSYWFDKTKYLQNIIQPACIVIDDINIIANDLPNIFIYVEPRTIYNVTNYLIENHNKYNTIFTFDDDILQKCPNAKKYIYGTTWIEQEYYNNIDILKKQYKISNLAGTKLINNSPGHQLRQVIHHNQNKFKNFPITFFRSFNQIPHITDYGNNPFLGINNSSTAPNNKVELFEEFQFSIVIENSQQKNYFTEKIVDCLITQTIPIYWGCPNINEFFDTSGWIILETTNIDELLTKLELLNETYYNKYYNTIEKNYNTAKKYVDIYENINNAI